MENHRKAVTTISVQVQPNRWTCLPVSFAMLIGVPHQKILEKLKYEGGPRDFHIQEIIDLLFVLGYSTTCIEAFPCFMFDSELWSEEKAEARLKEYLDNNCGVIVGVVNGHRHAAAWDGHQVYDPNGTIYGLGDHEWAIRYFYIAKNGKESSR